MPKILSNAKTQRNKYDKYLSYHFSNRDMCSPFSVLSFCSLLINLSSEAEHKTICKTLAEHVNRNSSDSVFAKMK